MGQDCGPFGADGRTDGLAQGLGLWRALALARWRMKPCSFFASTSSSFNARKRPSGNGVAGQGLGTSVFLDLRVSAERRASVIVLYAAGGGACVVREETMEASMDKWLSSPGKPSFFLGFTKTSPIRLWLF